MTLQDIGTIITALFSIGAVALSYFNFRKIQAVHVDLNSRLTEALDEHERSVPTLRVLCKGAGTSRTKQTSNDI